MLSLKERNGLIHSLTILSAQMFSVQVLERRRNSFDFIIFGNGICHRMDNRLQPKYIIREHITPSFPSDISMFYI